MVSYIFLTAAGCRGLVNKERGNSIEDLINTAEKVLYDFLIKGYRQAIKNKSKIIIKPKELADIEFSNYNL